MSGNFTTLSDVTSRLLQTLKDPLLVENYARETLGNEIAHEVGITISESRDLISIVQDVVETLESSGSTSEQYLELLERTAHAFDGLDQFVHDLSSVRIDGRVTSPNNWLAFALAIVGDIGVSVMLDRCEILVCILYTLGIVDTHTSEGTGTAGGTVVWEIRWDRVGFLTDPVRLMRDVYGFGDLSRYNGARVLSSLQWILRLLGASPIVESDPSDAEGAAILPPIPQKLVWYPSGEVDTSPLAISLVPVSDTSTGCGLAIEFDSTGGQSSATESIRFSGVDSARAQRLTIAQHNASLSGGDIDLEVLINLDERADLESEMFSLGTLVRVVGRGRRFRSTISKQDRTGLNFAAALEIDELSLIVDFSQLGACTVLGNAARSSIKFALLLGFSTRSGWRLQLTADRISLRLGSFEVGPVKFDIETILRSTQSGGLTLGSTFDISFSIGPIAGTLVGIQGGLRLSTTDGSLPRVQQDLQGPKGISLSLSIGSISGGGFISYIDSVGRYTGALSLEVGDIELHAVGILDTRSPGVSGYSFLIAISAEFTPVQLGMGFTLNGVGGLCGIQRAVALPALQAGVRTGSLTPLLFPRDPIGQASQLVTGLQNIFPPTTDRYVFGPMFKLGWGTPTIVTIDFGIILQLPAPISVALIGTINMIFPDQRVPTPIVAVHIDIAGSLDTGAKTLAIDASLRDSKIAGYDLTGDMALRLAWGDQPDFALSIGGFHKAFKPPPGFPELRRLSLGMVQSAFRLTCSAFLAVTSNTFQIGARAELYAEAAGFNVFGYVEFDALIIFSPFSFRFDFAAGLALRRGSSVIMGISVAGMISGPNPWHVQGSASISILFFEVSVSFDKTFGDTSTDPPPETITPWTELEKAVRDLHNWVAAPEPDAVRVVSCSAPPAADDQPRLDPLGRLGFHQRVLPLGRRLTKFGEKRVPSPTTLSLGSAQIGETAAPALQPLQENFAPGQFQQLSDAEKLSRPSFESMTAGALLSSDAWSVHAPEVTDLAYQVISIRNDQSRVLSGRLAIPSALDLETSLAAVAGQAPLEASADRLYAPPRDAAPLAALDDEHVVVVDAATLQPAEFHPDPTASPGHAYDAIARRLQEHPEELGTWRVVPMQDARMSHAA